MLPSHDPLPFIRLIVVQNQAVRARASGTDRVKSAVDVTSCTVQTNYSYSFWQHYSSEYEYTIRTTIRLRSEYEANIRYIPSLHSAAWKNAPLSKIIFFQFFQLSLGWLNAYVKFCFETLSNCRGNCQQ